MTAGLSSGVIAVDLSENSKAEQGLNAFIWMQSNSLSNSSVRLEEKMRHLNDARRFFLADSRFVDFELKDSKTSGDTQSV